MVRQGISSITRENFQRKVRLNPQKQSTSTGLGPASRCAPKYEDEKRPIRHEGGPKDYFHRLQKGRSAVLPHNAKHKTVGQIHTQTNLFGKGGTPEKKGDQ